MNANEEQEILVDLGSGTLLINNLSDDEGHQYIGWRYDGQTFWRAGYDTPEAAKAAVKSELAALLEQAIRQLNAL